MIDAFDSDEPIGDADEDLLARGTYVSQVASVLAQRSGAKAIVAGLYGSWGAGKSSILNLVARELVRKESVGVVRFNPWFFSGAEQLLERFLLEISNAVGGTPAPARQEAASAIKKYLRVLKPLSRVFATATAAFSPEDAALAYGAAEIANVSIDKTVQMFESVSESLDSNVSLESARLTVCSKLEKAGVRVVVMIDDIDRLEPEDIRLVLKMVRLVGDFPNVSYLLSFDPDIVARSLVGKGDAGVALGYFYLEKIVQVVLPLPRVRAQDLRKISMKGLEKTLERHEVVLSDSERRRLLEGWMHGVEPRLKTIRQAKRMLSAVGFSVGMLKGELNVVDLILMESIRILYPELFAYLVAQPEALFLRPRQVKNGEEPESFKALQAQIGTMSALEQQGVGELLGLLFPRFAYSRRRSDEEAQQWRRELRIASEENFEKFIGYGVPSDIISDAQYAAMLRQLVGGDVAGFAVVLDEISARCGWDDLIWRLRQDRHVVGLRWFVEVARAVARRAGRLSQQSPYGGVMSPCDNAALLVEEAIRHGGTATDAALLAVSLIQDCESLEFAAMVLRWMGAAERSGMDEQQRVAQSAALGGFARRVSIEFRIVDAIESGADVLFILHWWKVSAGEGVVGDVVLGLLKGEVSVVRRFVSLGIPFMGREKLRSVFWLDDAQSGYERLKKLVSPVSIAKTLGWDEGVRGNIQDLERLAAMGHSEQASEIFLGIYERGLIHGGG